MNSLGTGHLPCHQPKRDAYRMKTAHRDKIKSAIVVYPGLTVKWRHGNGKMVAGDKSGFSGKRVPRQFAREVAKSRRKTTAGPSFEVLYFPLAVPGMKVYTSRLNKKIVRLPIVHAGIEADDGELVDDL